VFSTSKDAIWVIQNKVWGFWSGFFPFVNEDAQQAEGAAYMNEFSKLFKPDLALPARKGSGCSCANRKFFTFRSHVSSGSCLPLGSHYHSISEGIMLQAVEGGYWYHLTVS